MLSDGFRINFDSDVGGRWRTGLHAGFSLLRKPPFALLDTDHERGKCAWKVPSLGPSSHLAVPGRDPAGSAAVPGRERSRRTDMLSQVCGGGEKGRRRVEQQQHSAESGRLFPDIRWLAQKKPIGQNELWNRRGEVRGERELWGKNPTKEDQYYSMTSSSRGVEIGASCFTGAAVIALTNPLDCLKQRWQVEPAVGGASSLGSFTRRIVVAEGLWHGLWRPGILSNMCACTISVGTRLGLYPMLRDSMRSPSPASSSPQQSGPVMMMLSGLAGGALGYIMSAPLFAASRVAQAETGLVSAEGLYTTGSRLGTKPTVASNLGLATLAHLFATQGLVGLWRGSEVLVARGALMSATQLTTYDWTKRQLKQELGVADGPALHIGSSFVASLTLTTAICPLDVIYTKFLHAGPPATPLSSARQLLHEGGAAALFRGWTPLWARFLPSSVLTFVIYEQSRRLLLGKYLE